MYYDIRYAWRILLRKSQGKRPFREDNIKMYLKRVACWRIERILLVWDPVAVSCKHRSEPFRQGVS
jgi:hypothetical protein